MKNDELKKLIDEIQKEHSIKADELHAILLELFKRTKHLEQK